MTDVFLYNGPIERKEDLRFIEFISEQKSCEKLVLILVTPGGSPDAAYKIAKYIQSSYLDFHCFIPGLCKSAGTLLAIGATELIFSPYGELGPLDIQLTKSDNIFGQESGLNISEAFRTVEGRAKQTFHNLVMEIIGGSGGVVSFQTASHCASEIVASLYGPIFGKIDAEEVGSRARAMRIGEDYGVRLNEKFKNLRYGALSQLSQSYSSHNFVIDCEEAMALFERVRMAEQVEKAVVQALGDKARFPEMNVHMENVTDLFAGLKAESEDQEQVPSNDTGNQDEDAGQADAAVSSTEHRPAKPNGRHIAAASGG